MGDLRERRIAAERGFLDAMVRLNPGRLEFESWHRERDTDIARVRLLDTPASLLNGSVSQTHAVRLVFPAYFPSVPIEAYLDVPVLHPNVHPENGFICLWEKHSAGDTMIQALLQTQRVITGKLHNSNPEHVMQPALDPPTPLPYFPLATPEDPTRPQFNKPRRRLSKIE